MWPQRFLAFEVANHDCTHDGLMLNEVGWYWDNGSFKAYCWWKKSCTIVDIKTISVFSLGVSCISRVAGFLPSTVCSKLLIAVANACWIIGFFGWPEGVSTPILYTRLVVELILGISSSDSTFSKPKSILISSSWTTWKHFGRCWQDFAFNWKILQCFSRCCCCCLVRLKLLTSAWCFCS